MRIGDFINSINAGDSATFSSSLMFSIGLTKLISRRPTAVRATVVHGRRVCRQPWTVEMSGVQVATRARSKVADEIRFQNPISRLSSGILDSLWNARTSAAVKQSGCMARTSKARKTESDKPSVVRDICVSTAAGW